MRSYGRLQLRDVAADGRMLIAPSDTRYRMYKRMNPDYGNPRDEPIDWLDESVAKSLSSKGDVLAFLQIADAGLTPDGYAAFVRRGRDAVQVGNAFAIGLVPDGSAAVLLCGAGAPPASSPPRWAPRARSSSARSRSSISTTGCGPGRRLARGRPRGRRRRRDAALAP